MNLDSIDFAAIAKSERLALEFRQECEQLSKLEFTPLLARATANTKIRKSMRLDYRITSLSLAHHRTAGNGINLCEQASVGCSAACVGSDNVGLAQMLPAIMESRIRRTRFLMTERTRFLRILIGELHGQQRMAAKSDAVLCCRLNQFSDLAWETADFGCIPQLFPEVQFWDYSKRMARYGQIPDNYDITWSWSELKRHQQQCAVLLAKGENCAVVFSDNKGSTGRGASKQTLPRRFKVAGVWYPVFDGNTSDLRFLDAGATRTGKGRICGLTLKAGNNVTRELAIGNGFSVHRGEV